jgi:hypothetical protein
VGIKQQAPENWRESRGYHQTGKRRQKPEVAYAFPPQVFLFIKKIKAVPARIKVSCPAPNPVSFSIALI